MSMAAISAHGPRAGAIEAYARALETGAEYVELDIRRTADGELAAFHDARTREGEALGAISYARLCGLAGYEVPRVADVMALIAGKAAGHPVWTMASTVSRGRLWLALLFLFTIAASFLVSTTLGLVRPRSCAPRPSVPSTRRCSSAPRSSRCPTGRAGCRCRARSGSM